MANIEHTNLTGAEIHEPKGADTASSGEVYVSDGAGSGSWLTPYLMGLEDYNDGGGSQSISAAYTALTNDGTGPFTNTTYSVPGSTGIWNTGTNQFDWTAGGLELGDSVLIRLDYEITTTSANDTITSGLRLGVGGSSYDLVAGEQLFKSAGTYPFIHNITVYMGDTNTLNNPAQAIMKTDGTGNSVTVNGWAVTSHLRTPTYA